MPCLLYSIWDWGRRCSHLACALHLAFPQLANPAKHYKHLEMLLKGERQMGGRERGRKIGLLGQGQRHSALEQFLPLPWIAFLSGCNTHTWSVDLLGFPLWRRWHRRKESLKKNCLKGTRKDGPLKSQDMRWQWRLRIRKAYVLAVLWSLSQSLVLVHIINFCRSKKMTARKQHIVKPQLWQGIKRMLSELHSNEHYGPSLGAQYGWNRQGLGIL